MGIKIFNIFKFLSSRKLALVLLLLVLFFSLLGIILPTPLANELIFFSLWFNLLLVFLTVNILFCTLKRVTNLFVFIRGVNSRSFVLLGSIIFHFSFILLTLGVVYDQLFFFEGGIRLTEGENLSCSDEQSYDWIRKGRFFKIVQLNDLGELYFHKLYPSYYVKNDYKGVANKIILRTESNPPAGGKEGIIYANSPLRYKWFEFYRDVDGNSPLFVLRDRWGRVLDGAYAPLHSARVDKSTPTRRGEFIRPTYVYIGGFPFPAGNPFFGIWSVYYPATKSEEAKIFLEIRQDKKVIFKGKAILMERVRVENFFVSVEEVRYWSRLKVIYRPGLGIIFTSFWFALGGISLTTVAKMIPLKNP